MFSSKQSETKSPANLKIEETNILDDADIYSEVDIVDVDRVAEHEPHFLDYDAVPPPEFNEGFNITLSSNIRGNNFIRTDQANEICGLTGEQLKLDKKYERDGEISDYELAASGYTKKEFTQDDNTLHIATRPGSGNRDMQHREISFGKSKHFLDENPIPPDYMLDQELREHRSLDRNFERHNEHRTRLSSIERKCSLDRVSHSSREKLKEPFYTLSRFLDNEGETKITSSKLRNFIPKGEAWAVSSDSRFGFSHLATRPSLPSDIDTLGPKVECVYSLLSMLGSNDTLEMSKKFLELSRTPETCAALRRSGCIPLLVQIMNSDGEENVRKCASLALHNVVHSHTDEKAGRREAKVLRLLDQLIEYCNFLKTLLQSGGEAIADDSERHPLAAISSLMKVSFDEEHRHAMCELGALLVIPSLVHLDHAVHGPKPEEQCCNSLRRYALMALTNLTFGDENNKALLCSQKLFMEALVVQLDCAPDDLLQVTASVLRNLSWRADNNMKAVLNEIGTVTALANAAMKNKSENTLKAILSALWNLSAHCSTNKAEFCSVDGALAFLVDMLTYEGPSKTLKIIENAGGILRNVSSHIAVCGHYREILRERNCLGILLQQLKSESLTVVSNSCGTLWNLSARCPIDQKFLWDNGAVPMLRSLIHSKHAMISEGSSSALKNLLNFRPSIQNQTQLDHIARSMGLKKLPTLNARKQKALEQELGDKKHSETCDNLDIGPRLPTEHLHFENQLNLKRMCTPLSRTGGAEVNVAHTVNSPIGHLTRSTVLPKSDSRDSVFSAKSDSAYENFVRTHSEADESPKSQKIKYAVETKKEVFPLDNDVGHAEEKPIDYSMQFNENTTKTSFKEECEVGKNNDPKEVDSGSSKYATYQETDIDQPTDFSLRYAENQVESDIEVSPPDADITTGACSVDATTANHIQQQVNSGNEILLLIEDSVKCYQTEDTPYIISNAASVTDLHQNKSFNAALDSTKTTIVGPTKKYQKQAQPAPMSNLGFGAYTPEKPINYCEEGTPGYFSRYESLSSLNESPPQGAKSPSENAAQGEEELKSNIVAAITPSTEPIESLTEKECTDRSPKLVDVSSININLNSAQETPLMFSRHSSLDSLVEEDVCPCDDKSSIVSDFSRMASGVISPSDIPDSPTQSMPQSPRRNSALGTHTGPRTTVDLKQLRLRSVFEDGLNTFHEENTPAQFSSATSLSNLSIIDDENSANQSQHPKTKTTSSGVTIEKSENVPLQSNTISEGEEDLPVNDDELLLARCINIGMSRSNASPPNKITSKTKVERDLSSTLLTTVEIPKQYYTEDTPALLSKVGSNTNLSILSINSNAQCKEENVFDMKVKCAKSEENLNFNRDSLNLSDEISSHASETGNNSQSLNVVQHFLRDGMKKPLNATSSTSKLNEKDPIEMMKSGGNNLTYLPVSDELSKFVVEDTPCNFSVVSALSNLTVGSSLVGPAIQIKGNSNIDSASLTEAIGNNMKVPNHIEGHPDDSLSSLSIDSEDDTNLLSQAIAAGCNRPKSNLGFSSLSINTKRSPSLSVSQPISINSALSTSSLTSTGPTRNVYRRQHSKQNNNDSYSSVDSSDSNDNQSKSLFELCILTGMNKRNHSSISNNNKREKPVHNNLRNESASTSISRLKNTRSITDPLQFPKHQSKSHNWIQHEQERKDEQLLRECINTGISKKIGAPIGPSNKDLTTSQDAIKTHETLVYSNVPKNAKATSAAALEPYHQKEVTTSQSANSTVAPDVGMNIVNRTNANKHNTDVITDGQKRHQMEIQQKPTSAINTNIQTQRKDQRNRRDIGFSDSDGEEIQKPVDLGISECCSSDSFILETSLSLENTNKNIAVAVNKHKDPDLMMQSVERLTQEFVASAELLRTIGCSESTGQNKVIAINSLADTVSSNSNNTWNEDTCPNDVSFPSVSISAPVVGVFNSNECEEEDNDSTDANHRELNDFAEITPTNEQQPEASLEVICADMDFFSLQQPNSIETDSDTLVIQNYSDACETNGETGSDGEIISNGINFILGGEVQNASVTRPSHLVNCLMNNSTIIAMEARNLAENFLQNYEESNKLTYSINSLDLDNIRPPSGMESLTISGYFEDSSKVNSNCLQSNVVPRLFKQQSPSILTKSPKFPRKSIPTGFVARRALGQLPVALSASTESVNSSCMLLENIKPPSLMDELLDSMISVSSIQSEVADCDSLATTVSVSNYETAAGGLDFDDNTVTLQSCYEGVLPLDKDEDASINSSTLLASDFEYSSAESTPKKSQDITHGVKRTLTPKQKRKLAKDRFKTYTIMSDIVLDNVEVRLSGRENEDEDERIQIEIEENVLPQQIDSVSNGKFNSICYKVQNITQAVPQKSLKENNFVNNCSVTSIECSSNDYATYNKKSESVFNCEYNSVDYDKNSESVFECEYNSVEYDQNSETESCHGQEGGDIDINTENTKTSNGCIKEHNQFLRARITKPGETDETTLNVNGSVEVEQNISIRGRKKPAYVSPYKMQCQRSTIARNQNKNNRLSPSTSSKIKANSKVVGPVVIVSHQKCNDQLIKNITPIERQGTFVKEEPSTSNVHVPVVDTVPVQTGSPKRSSKLPTKKVIPSPKSKLSNLRNTPASAPSNKINPIRKVATTTTTQRSNSNASLKITSATARSAALSSRISTTTPPSRSNSNLTSYSLTPTTGKINQVQSRIAGIWKRSDDEKNKQKPTVTTASNINLKTDCSPLQKNLFKSSTPSINKHKSILRCSTVDTIPKNEDKTNKTGQINLRIESKFGHSKIAVNKASLARKENIGSRK